LKKNISAFFLSFIVALIYAACWLSLSYLLDVPPAFSASKPVSTFAFQLFYGFLYIFPPFIFVFLLMKRQVDRPNLAQARLKATDDTLECQVQSRTAELEKMMGDIKTLKGIITICANCKNIRNSKGQWETVESYIQRHTEAQFSHGLCNDCQYALYGEKYSRVKTAQAD
jgi:hypothetical protein